MNELSVTISERLKDIRLKSRLTQSEMAEKVGVALRSYQNYESGDRFPKKSVRNKMCKAFNLTETELVFGISENNEVATGNNIQEVLGLISKISQLNEKNLSFLEKTIDQMVLGQKMVKQKNKENLA
jgi:transcriptional regulator with XRE-family HTH domain